MINLKAAQPHFECIHHLQQMLTICVMLMPSIYWTMYVPALNYEWVRLCCAFVVEMSIVVFASILFVVSMCFINNSVPPQHVCLIEFVFILKIQNENWNCLWLMIQCGKANGIAQSGASLMRAAGPVWFHSYLSSVIIEAYLCSQIHTYLAVWIQVITGFIWSESVQYIDNAPYAVYWAYLPTTIGLFGMSFHMYWNIRPEFQFTWEKQIEMRKNGVNAPVWLLETSPFCVVIWLGAIYSWYYKYSRNFMLIRATLVAVYFNSLRSKF